MRVKFADVERIQRDREQLWAEGADMFKSKGIDWSAERLAQDAHNDFRIRDPWEDVIAAWMGEPDLDGRMPFDYPYIPTSELLVSALGITVAKMTQRDVKRLAAAMRALGYTSTVVKDKGVSKRAWIRK